MKLTSYGQCDQYQAIALDMTEHHIFNELDVFRFRILNESLVCFKELIIPLLQIVGSRLTWEIDEGKVSKIWPTNIHAYDVAGELEQ